jgi:hypothetical protein
MVSRYNISINYKLRSLQCDPRGRKKIIEQYGNLSIGAAFTGTTGGEAGLASFIFILLVPLI